MSTDLAAERIVHCPQGSRLLVKARGCAANLIGLARKAAAGNRKAQEFLVARRAEKDDAWRLYVEHVESCSECKPRGASS